MKKITGTGVSILRRRAVSYILRMGGTAHAGMSNLELATLSAKFHGALFAGTGSKSARSYLASIFSKDSSHVHLSGNRPLPRKTKTPIATNLTFYDSREWQALRYKALLLYGASCQCCGATRRDGIKLHVDHIKPRSKFPELKLEITNLQILCESCNMGKSNIDDTDWR